MSCIRENVDFLPAVKRLMSGWEALAMTIDLASPRHRTPQEYSLLTGASPSGKAPATVEV